MKINWKVRFSNKVWLLTFVAAALSLMYEVLAIFGVTPKVEQEQLKRLAEMLIGLLVMIGVVIDPTTKGTSDSEMAMTYKKPRDELGGEHTAEFTDTAHEINDPVDASTENVEG